MPGKYSLVSNQIKLNEQNSENNYENVQIRFFRVNYIYH